MNERAKMIPQKDLPNDHLPFQYPIAHPSVSARLSAEANPLKVGNHAFQVPRALPGRHREASMLAAHAIISSTSTVLR